MKRFSRQKKSPVASRAKTPKKNPATLSKFGKDLSGDGHRRAATAEKQERSGKKTNAQEEIVRLQNDLSAAREFLQASTEQQEAVNEELQASNEEAQSANEELQSINEELETTKEELKSSNEELRTVNEEMGNRNAELHRINSDLHNVLNGVQMCIVVLGSDLCIRRFTPLAKKVLNLVPTDVGRPITNIKPNIDFPDLEPFILRAIEEVRPQHTEAQDKAGRWVSIRALPYKTIDNKIDGAVLALADIDALKRSEERIQAALDFAQNTIKTVREPLLVLNGGLRVESANRSFYKTFRVAPEETLGRPLYELGNGEWNIPKLRVLLQEILPRNSSFDDFDGARFRASAITGSRRCKAPSRMIWNFVCAAPTGTITGSKRGRCRCSTNKGAS